MDLLSADEVARHLRLNVKRVQALAREGRLPGRRVGRKWLFDRRDLDRALGTTAAARSRRHRPQREEPAPRHASLALAVEGVMAEVTVAVGDQELVSVITRGSAERLGLRVGDEVSRSSSPPRS